MSKRFHKQARQRRAQTAGVMVEFLVLAPLIITFLFGLLEMGRMFSQITWLSQTSYQATMAGSEKTVVQGRVTSMNQMAAKLLPLHNLGLRNRPLLSTSYTPTTRPDLFLVEGSMETRETIISEVSGEMRILGKFFMPLNIKVIVAGPALVTGSGVITTPDGFKDPSEFKGCDGLDVTGSASCTPCGSVYDSGTDRCVS